MFNRIYQKALKTVILATIFILGTRGWTVVCLNIATNIYFGSKSTWGQFFIVSDVVTRSAKYDIISTSFYEVTKEPISAITLDPEECLMNKCRPDIIVSKDQSFVAKTLKTFPARKISDKLESYIKAESGVVTDDKTIASFSIWGDVFYAAIPQNSAHYHYTSLLLKEIILSELYRQNLPKEKILKILQEKERKSEKKMREIQKQYSRRNEKN